MADRAERHWHQLTLDGVFERLETGREGLNPAEAARRLTVTGRNELVAREGISPAAVLLHQVGDPLILILFLAAAVTVVLGSYTDAIVILAVVVLNSTVGFIQEYKAEKALRALARMVAPKARVLRSGQEQEVDARTVVPGDVVVLEAGFRVPADIRLVRTVELAVDESALTGESVPVTKGIEPIADPAVPVADRRNMAFMGTVVVRGRGIAVVVATGPRTALGRISTEVEQVGEVRLPLQERLAGLGRWIGLAVLGISTGAFALGVALGHSPTEMLLVAVALAVDAVPESLPVVVTVALAVGVHRMARRNAIVRRLPAVEALGSCTVIGVDKTGTLTKNEMTVTRIWAGGRTYAVTGVGYAPVGQILLDDLPVDLDRHPALAMSLRIGLLCNDADVYRRDGRFEVDGDPTEAALIVAAQKAGLEREEELAAHPLLDEIPFESERQYMASLHAWCSRRLILVKGAPEHIVKMSRATLEDGRETPLDRQAALDQFHGLAAEGLRVLALAHKPAGPEATEVDHRDVESGLVFDGLVAMVDPPRPEAIAALGRCKEAGIRVVMITGDHEVTARAIAERMGLVGPEAHVLSGRPLEAMADDELYRQVEHVSVYARATPEHKLRIVQQFRRRGEVVAVTGDGVNDAPALKAAHIGIAMGLTGTDVAREAADMVLTDDNFATIYAAVEEGRVIFDNIRKVVLFLFPTGVSLVLATFASFSLGLPLIFLPSQIIWSNLVTNGLQDVAMAFEPGEPDAGKRPPRDPQEGLVNRVMIERTVLIGLAMAVGTLLVFAWELGAGASVAYARSVALTTMVLFQNVHIFNVRTGERPFYAVSPLANPLLFVVIAAAIALHSLALYLPPFQFVLHTEPIALSSWLTILPLAAIVLIAGDLEKRIRRWRSAGLAP